MPEQGWRLKADGVFICERSPVRLEITRVRGATPDTAATLSHVTGTSWPGQPGAAAGRSPRVLCLAPGEWAVLNGRWSEHIVRTALSPATLHTADLSHGRIAFDAVGVRIRDLLSKGTSLDLHPRVLPYGRCAQAKLAQLQVLFDPLEGGGGFSLYVDVSCGAHLRRWFEAAAAECFA